jgi:enoyl-CoA hydratase/carnithine racemase
MIVSTPLPGGRLIELARPARRNALDLDAVAALREEIAAAVAAGDRGLILAGRGGNFCAGGDIKQIGEVGPEYSIELGARGNELTRELEAAPLLSIAVLEGACVGGGAELALACDVRIAVAGSFWKFPEVQTGAIPAWGGIRMLPELIGAARARQLLLTARPLNCELLTLAGLIATVLPDRAAADTEARTYLDDAAASSANAFARIKDLLGRGPELTAAEMTEAELEADREQAGEFFAAVRTPGA